MPAASRKGLLRGRELDAMDDTERFNSKPPPFYLQRHMWADSRKFLKKQKCKKGMRI